MTKHIIELELGKIYKGSIKYCMGCYTFRAYGENIDSVIEEFDENRKYVFETDENDELSVFDIESEYEEYERWYT